MAMSDNLTCEDCGEVYESTTATRKIKNRLGRFICPDCLAEAKEKLDAQGKAPKEEEKEEEGEEEDAEEEEAPHAPPVKPKKK